MVGMGRSMRAIGSGVALWLSRYPSSAGWGIHSWKMGDGMPAYPSGFGNVPPDRQQWSTGARRKSRSAKMRSCAALPLTRLSQTLSQVEGSERCPWCRIGGGPLRTGACTGHPVEWPG